MNHIVRKHRRVDLDYMARVLTLAGEAVSDCALMDVSQGGARLAVLAADMIPNEFLLLLSATSSVRRRCKVAWRKEDEIGVIFVKDMSAQKAIQTIRRARLLETPCP
jgi:hypothetical protein